MGTEIVTNTHAAAAGKPWWDGLRYDFQECWDLFDERCAIREFDGGFSADEAADLAWWDMLRMSRP